MSRLKIDPTRTFQRASRLLHALEITEETPVDADLLALLELAAASPDVAAFLHAVADNSAVGVIANIDPPPTIAAAVSQAGVDWSKFFVLMPRLARVLAALESTP